MIDIKDKSKRCGCEACSQICPKSCISIIAEEQGLLYTLLHPQNGKENTLRLES